MKRKIFYGLGTILVAATGLGLVANSSYYAWPAWSQKIACAVGNCPRFIVLSDWNSEAVLDRETGLVWEQSPATVTRTWFVAQACNTKTVGGRKGWRLPTIPELASLIDPTIAPPGPTLPPGHPFSNVQSSFYWSATTKAGDTDSAWGVDLNIGNVFSGNKTFPNQFWCVRGGQGIDGVQ